jgi:hypothetical protein
VITRVDHYGVGHLAKRAVVARRVALVALGNGASNFFDVSPVLGDSPLGAH